MTILSRDPVLRVDLAAIDRAFFTVEERQTPAGPLVLVCPKKQKLKWEPGEEHLRSLLCYPDGEIVSSGFPKFSNYGERRDLDEITERALQYGSVIWTEKLDGTLIIRSVVDGVVLWRTRGSHELGKFEGPVMAHIRERHPMLLDVRLAAEVNLLFEWTAPDNQIVLRYPEPALTLLGGVAHHVGYLHVLPASALTDWQWTPTVPVRELPGTMDELRAAVTSWKDREGVVAWCTTGKGCHLAKFKSARYLALHAFKSHVTERKVWGYCETRQIANPGDLQRDMEADGFDWETVEYALPWLGTYMERRRAMNEATARIIEQLQRLPDDADRKTRALAAREACDTTGHPDLFAWAIAYVTGDLERAADARSAHLLEMGLNEFRARRPAMLALSVGEAPDE